MSLSNAQAMYSNSQPVQQAPGGGGGNRYIPPTFNYRQNTGNPYAEMDWNNVQNYNLPQHGNNPFTQQYMGGLRESLGGFGGRYPRQQPVMPQFGGGRGGFDPMRMMMQMYQGMGPEQLFGFGGRRGHDSFGMPQAYFDPNERIAFGGRGGGGYEDLIAQFYSRLYPQGGGNELAAVKPNYIDPVKPYGG